MYVHRVMRKRSIFGSVDYKMSLTFVVFLCLIFKVSALDITLKQCRISIPNFMQGIGTLHSPHICNSYTDETSHCVRATYKELSMFTFIPMNCNEQGQYSQFGCGILKVVGPKMQYFCPRINMLKGNSFKKNPSTFDIEIDFESTISALLTSHNSLQDCFKKII